MLLGFINTNLKVSVLTACVLFQTTRMHTVKMVQDGCGMTVFAIDLLNLATRLLLVRISALRGLYYTPHPSMSSPLTWMFGSNLIMTWAHMSG